MDRDAFERRLLKLSLQVYRRGFYMPIWNLRQIVERRLMRELFKRLRMERDHHMLQTLYQRLHFDDGR